MSPVPNATPPHGTPDEVVQAAGAVIWRRQGTGLEVVLVHRPRYDDWTIPKGKLDAGEDHATAAVREILEETRLHVALGPKLPSTTYIDRSGRTKVVSYWAAVAIEGEAAGDNEVDQALWLSLPEAKNRISYERDRPVLEALESTVGRLAAWRPVELDHIVLSVSDIEASLNFWCGLLGLEGVRIGEWRRGEVGFPSVRVNGDTIIDLFARDQAALPAGSLRSELDHVCLVIEGDLGAIADEPAFTVLDSGPRFGARGTGQSVYLQGPEGLVVELRTYS